MVRCVSGTTRVKLCLGIVDLKMFSGRSPGNHPKWSAIFVKLLAYLHSITDL